MRETRLNNNLERLFVSTKQGRPEVAAKAAAGGAVARFVLRDMTVSGGNGNGEGTAKSLRQFQITSVRSAACRAG